MNIHTDKVWPASLQQLNYVIFHSSLLQGLKLVTKFRLECLGLLTQRSFISLRASWINNAARNTESGVKWGPTLLSGSSFVLFCFLKQSVSCFLMKEMLLIRMLEGKKVLLLSVSIWACFSCTSPLFSLAHFWKDSCTFLHSGNARSTFKRRMDSYYHHQYLCKQ